MTENETIPGAFKALITGYGIIGLDYAYIPATSVPEFSLKGDKPFTIFTTICFKNTQNGSILEQKDMFQMGIMDGLLYVAAIDWCVIKFSEYKVAEFVTDRWYSIAIVYDGKILSAWLEGEKKDSFKCKAPYKGKAEKELCIGKRLDAYFKNFLIFDRALSGNEINSLTSGEENIVKMFIEKSVIFRTSAVYHSHILGIKTFGDNGFNHPAGVRRVGTWFQYNCISGCNRIDQRINGEQERIIPWAHNQDNTIRRWLLIASGSELGKGSQYCFFFCIGRCMADHVAEF